MTDDGGSPPKPTMEEAKRRLRDFLKHNPHSSIDLLSPEDDNSLHVKNPWGDSSLIIYLGDLPDAIIETLNQLLLPERYSAIWHRDYKSLEVIWTALPLSADLEELKGRKFEFRFKGKKHVCHFTKSSDRLMELAKFTLPITSSGTNFRNLNSYHRFAHRGHDRDDPDTLGEPLSFWVANVSWQDANVLELLENLNFHLAYYDKRSPLVVIHPPPDDGAPKGRSRYIVGKFPKIVTGKALDPNLVSFWSEARLSDPQLAYLLYYRIIEYAAAHFLDEGIRIQLRRLLVAPNLADNLPDALNKIVAAVSPAKIDDHSKVLSVWRRCVDAKYVWQEVSQNLDFFSEDCLFDGGFKAKAIVGKAESESTFCGRPQDGLVNTLRSIRNTLAHGKDQETGTVIRPTTHNAQLLRPWVYLLGIGAGEVVLLKDVT